MLDYLKYLNVIAGVNANSPNLRSVAGSLVEFGEQFGLHQPHRFVQFGAQVGHESGRFKYDRELWGPTPAQERYDTRTDLGNTPERDGDGKKNAGRGPIQLTGGYNIATFEAWCVERFGRAAVPDFSGNPDLINTDPWEGLSAMFYWDTRGLNRLADRGDNENITLKINGGLNGYADRLKLYTQLGLAVLGHDNLSEFQRRAKANGTYTGELDGSDGPLTRSAIHQELVKLGSLPVAATQAAPVVEPVAVAPQGADKVAMTRTFGLTGLLSMVTSFFVDMPLGFKLLLLILSVVAVVVLIWKAELIARRVKTAFEAFNFIRVE